MGAEESLPRCQLVDNAQLSSPQQDSSHVGFKGVSEVGAP